METFADLVPFALSVSDHYNGVGRHFPKPFPEKGQSENCIFFISNFMKNRITAYIFDYHTILLDLQLRESRTNRIRSLRD